MPHLTIGVFASGTGSNCKAIFEAIRRGDLDASIGLVISNNADAPILTWARDQQIESRHLSSEMFSDRHQFHEEVIQSLKRQHVNFIALAGYMRKIGQPVLDAFPRKVLNIHPALLPAFGGKGMYGIHVHQAVVEYGAKVTGVTVHLVDGEYDHGAIVMQRTLEVLSADTAQSLAERVLAVEHDTYFRALQLFAEDRVRLEGRKVIVS